MKFAVVEYSSKTGKIWRHTPEKPNYLADPQNEMDPTSFGCYVSALNGEHVPITFLVEPTVWKKVYKKVTGNWPEYDISYMEKFDALLIVHQISDGHEVTAFTKRIKKRFPHIKILGVPTQPYGILRDYWKTHPTWLKNFQEFMDLCDVFITIVEATKPDWQKLTTSRVEYIAQPYPVEYASRYFEEQSGKRNTILVAGRVERDNIKKGFEVAAALQKEFPDYTIHITEDEPGVSIDTSLLKDTHFEVQPFLPWHKHLTYLNKVALVINTDYTLTRGRVQVDCAAVGTPSIGANSDGQVDLFPALPATRTQSVDELIAQGKKLLADSAFYEDVTATAQQKLQQYDYAPSAKRIVDLVHSL